MAVNNNTILAKAFLNGTNDYQQRIGDPAQQDIAVTVQNLFDPMNKQYYNQFQDFLVNRIGASYARGKAFENPLAAFKGEKLNYGSTIEEYAPEWVKSHSYEIENEAVFKNYLPKGKAWFYTQNRQEYYPITIDQAALKAAFVDEYGLNNYISKIMQVPMNSDNYDEYRIMVQLIAEYEQRWGFFKHQLSAAPTDEATGKEFLTAIRTYAGKLKFPSTLYNCSELENIPVFVQPDELVLFVTPETAASVSVQVLADIFNVDLADINVRQVLIDEFPIPNAVALLTTQDFIVAHDTVYQNESQYNPLTLGTSYFLHHWGIYSPNPFVPAILFTTDAETEVPVLTMEPDGITITAQSTVKPGEWVPMVLNMTGDVDDGIFLRPDACSFEINAWTPADAETETDIVPIQLNSRTRVDDHAILHIQKSGLAAGDIIEVVATSTYTNPSGETEVFTATKQFTVE